MEQYIPLSSANRPADFQKIHKLHKCVCPIFSKKIYCERREHPSQTYGTPKKCNKILNIGRRTILYKTFFYTFSILN